MAGAAWRPTRRSDRVELLERGHRRDLSPRRGRGAGMDRPGSPAPAELLESLGRMGDPEGSTSVRDRLLQVAQDKSLDFDLRLGAANGLETMGLGESVKAVLDYARCEETSSSLMVVEARMKSHAAKSRDER